MKQIWRCRKCRKVLGVYKQDVIFLQPADCRFWVKGSGEVIQVCQNCSAMNTLMLGGTADAIQ